MQFAAMTVQDLQARHAVMLTELRGLNRNTAKTAANLARLQIVSIELKAISAELVSRAAAGTGVQGIALGAGRVVLDGFEAVANAPENALQGAANSVKSSALFIAAVGLFGLYLWKK